LKREDFSSLFFIYRRGFKMKTYILTDGVEYIVMGWKDEKKTQILIGVTENIEIATKFTEELREGLSEHLVDTLVNKLPNLYWEEHKHVL
jgi:hypothetical protein